jgi:hypothetical protein
VHRFALRACAAPHPGHGLSAGLLAAIDEAAKAHGLTRSAFIATAAREKIAKGG